MDVHGVHPVFTAAGDVFIPSIGGESGAGGRAGEPLVGPGGSPVNTRVDSTPSTSPCGPLPAVSARPARTPRTPIRTPPRRAPAREPGRVNSQGLTCPYTPPARAPVRTPRHPHSPESSAIEHPVNTGPAPVNTRPNRAARDGRTEA